MRLLLLIILVWFLVLRQVFSEANKLLLVQIIFRHGDRAPITLYPNDPNPASVWPEGLAALTTLGKKQQYALGKYFRARYENFTTSSPLEVNVISSEADRCLESAETNLASFYAPHSKWSFDAGFPWQPIAIHYLPQNQDKYLEDNSYCPCADEEEERVMKSPEGQKFLKEHEEMFRNLSTLSGFPVTNWREASDLHDVLFIEKKYNLTVPAWVEPFWTELVNVSNLHFFWSFNSPLLHRLRAGPQIQRMVEVMNQKTSGELPNLKFQIYSAHDTSIAVVLDALNLFNMIQPPYCSALLFELFEMPDGVKAVRMLYQNSSRVEDKIDPPQVLILEGCSEFCPLDYFVNYTRPLIPGDWDQECQLSTSFIKNILKKEIAVGWSLIVMGVVIAVMVVPFLCRTRSHKQDKEAISTIKYFRLDGP